LAANIAKLNLYLCPKKGSMKTTGIVYTLLGAILILTLQRGCAGDADNGKRPPRKAKVERTLATATSKLNRNCPEMIDPETRLDSVILSDESHLTYYYTLIGRETGTINEDAFRAYIFPSIINNVHVNTDLKMHRDSGVVIDFYYRDRNGEPITDISIGPDRYR
jgi:hypothetical protein